VIYFIHGPDRFLARQTAQAIVERLDPAFANTSWLDGRETTPERLMAAVGTVSFFDAPRVVVVTDFIARSGRDAAGSDDDSPEDGRPSRNAPALAMLLAAVPNDHSLILLEPGLMSAPAALKSAAPNATVVAGDPPRGSALLAWLEEAAVRSGSSIDQRAAQRLAESLYPQTWDRKPNNPRYDRPPDMGALTQEIEKLSLAALPGPITAEVIDSLVPGGPDQRVFRFLDAALAGDMRTSAAELERLEAAGEEPAMLLAQLLGQVELTSVAASAGNRDAAAVARDLGSVSPSRMSGILASARRMPPRPAEAVGAAVDTDRKLKTGRLRRPNDALHAAVLHLALLAERNNGRSR
jgi:DNA polymerase III delta subunit